MIQLAQHLTVALRSDNRTRASLSGFILDYGLTPVYVNYDWTTSLAQSTAGGPGCESSRYRGGEAEGGRV